MIRYSEEKYTKQVVDQGFGPINVATANFNGEIYLAVANHTSDNATIYKLD